MVRGKPELRSNPAVLVTLLILLLPALNGCTGGLPGNATPGSGDPPTAPSNLVAIGASSTQVNLTWSASTDANGVTGYMVERCTGANCSNFAQIGTTSGATNYSDTGLTVNTSYSYRVRAADAKGLLSGYSNLASATTPDTTAPTAPANLKAADVSPTDVNLTWTASTDMTGVTGYLIERCTGNLCTSFTQIATTNGSTTMYSDSNVIAGTSYSYRVRATDAAGNKSGYSNVSSTITAGPPTTPSNLTATAISATQINLSWTASTDVVGVTGYLIERCAGAGCSSFAQIATTGGNTTTYSDTGLAATSYSYRVRATDAASLLSGYSNVATANTADTTPPTSPSNLTAMAISSTQINLSWTGSTDNVGVTGYLIERCAGAGCSSFAQIATTAGGTTTYSNTGLTVLTSYSYRVRATDAAGNKSGYSNVASATTPDTTAPSAPSNLVATAASGSQIGLTWTASTDNVGVTGYQIWRCTGSGCSPFAQIATIGSSPTSYTDTGLSASTTYTYEVRATDAAGNLSSFSNTAAATTQSSGGSSITVSVSPRRGGLTVTEALSITATLTNDTTNAGVTWSTNTGTGSFSSTTSTSGVPVTFTAPGSAGVLTITATSNFDNSKTATATVGVTDLAGITTYMYDNTRQGANSKEYALATSGPTAVNASNFGKLFSCSVDAAIYGEPLWVANLTIGGATHNVVYVATQHDTVYAFDADLNTCTVLWQTGASGVNSLLPSGQSWVSSSDVSCGDLTPDIGIVSTPVIDLGTNTLYVVTKSKTTSGTTTYHQLLHALDITTGGEKFSGPQEISGSASGNGNGSVGGVLTFDPLVNNQRSALALENGHVLIAWSSHCDNGTYHGWLMSYNASTLAQEAVFNDTPNGALGGIWMSGNGPAVDSSGNIYLATGNGTFDANQGSAPNNDYGDSVVKFGPPSGGTFPVLSYFTPFNEHTLESGDIDQGSGGVMLLPDVTVSGVTQSYLVQAGKDGNVYLLNRNGLGGFNSSNNNGAAQEISGQTPGGLFSSASYFNGSLYFGAAADGVASSDPMRAFSFDAGGTGKINSTPTSTTASTEIFGFSGPTAPISSNGTSNAIVWALDNSRWSNSCPGCQQVVYAYDATNLNNMFYNSSQASGNRDLDGGAVKFTVPTVANGKVYVGNQNTLTVYGLLP